MKKLVAMVLILALVLTGAGAAFAAAPADVAGSKYEEAVNVLIEAGVVEGYPDGSFQPAKGITRAEACKIAVLTAAEGNRVPAATLVASAAAATEAFSDVAADFWGAGYIGYAVEQGIVNGYPDGSFRADANVTYYEMIKMTVAALGYKAEDLSGVWPDNYINKAKELGLLEGLIYTDGNAAAGRGDVALLSYNSLSAAGPGEAEPETPIDNPAVPTGFDLSTFRGVMLGVVQSTGSIVNKDGEAVSAVNFLLGNSYAGDVPSKKGSPADTTIPTLNSTDYLDGTLYALKVVKGEITEYSTTAAGITWINKLAELTPDVDAPKNPDGFYTIDSVEKSTLMAFEDNAKKSDYIIFEDSVVVYLLKEGRDTAYYEVGKVGDIKRGAEVRMYDVTEDDDLADIVIIDKR